MLRAIIIFISLFVLSGCLPEPEIQLSGIESNKVYPDARIIKIDEETAGTFTMQLNGKDIQNGHEVTGNGEYELSVTAERWWNEDTKTITFEIDDQPPKKPEFKDELKKIYYKEVKFRLVKEDGVKYKVTMDGKPNDIGKAYTKEGEHTLYIQAEKENGLTSDKKVNFQIDNRTYSRNTVDTFKQLYFHNGEKSLTEVIKWTYYVGVYVHGKPTTQDSKVFKSYFDRLNEMLPIEFKILKNGTSNYTNHQLDIYFVPTHKFKDYGFKEDLRVGNKQVVGVAIPEKVTTDGKIITSKILVGTDTDQQLRKTTILHEITHSLGLYGHLEDTKKSILYPYNNNRITKLSEIDKKLIEILYREDIKPGMSEKDVQRVLEPRIKG
ncbi:DUF2927 domain-containing protein [Alkalihalobacillus sp. TS-13]|uniref:DUF2927 domain-containing protein n=1 Tax=Alkalihalobacillus sp. TS-13 TaxID=2842455 RepID=UPI001C88230D|nr:DUF2927 domain-containing protein [Alkalihalobacillus sp. TS-13]